MKNVFIHTTVAAVLFAMLAFCVVGCGSINTENGTSSSVPATVDTEENDNNQDGSIAGGTAKSSASSNEIEALIDIKAVPTLEGTVCVFITNNSDVVIGYLTVQTNFFDEDGLVIDLDEDRHDAILPGYTVVSEMKAPDSYADYETTFSIDLDKNSSYENHSDDVDVSANSGDDCVIVQITNNSDVEIEEIEYIVVFYLGDDISSVSYAKDIRDVPSGETVTEKVSAFKVEYDRFEVYLNQAHTFGL